MYNPTKPYKYQILSLIQSTWQTPYLKMERGIYPVLKKKFNYPEVQHTDGIGTKGFFHWQKRDFRAAVRDALAMNLNDLLLVGAQAYSLQNHIVLPQDDHRAILSIVRYLAQECRQRQIAMTGGETSIHQDQQAMDLSITVAGFIKKKIKNQCQSGDILIGLPSNGLHSNGWTRAKEILGKTQAAKYSKATIIYYDQVYPLLAKHIINGLMHITGGAFTKLRDILGESDVQINFPKKFKAPEVFYKIFAKSKNNKLMYTSFNCGIGFILSVSKNEVNKILKKLPHAIVLGTVSKGNGQIKIQSIFDNKEIKL